MVGDNSNHRLQNVQNTLHYINMLKTLALLFFTGFQHCFAQNTSERTTYLKLEKLESHILSNFKLEQGYLDTACLNTAIYLKFKIIGNRPASIEFTKTTPDAIKHAIEKILAPHKGSLYFLNGSQYENKTIMIPMLFIYNSNCKASGKVSVDKNGELSGIDITPNTALILAFRNIMVFDNQNASVLECTLLPPMYFTSLL